MKEQRENLRLSKKFTFSVLSLLSIFWAVDFVKSLDFSKNTELFVIIACHVSIVIVTVAYITGQAKIDMNIKAGFNGFNSDIKRK